MPSVVSKRKDGSKRVAFDGGTKSKTKQDDTPGTLIQNIIERAVSGHAVEGSKKTLNLGDVSKIPTNIIDAKKLLDDAARSFNSLPARTRAQFKNDPGRFIAWMDTNPSGDMLVAAGVATLPAPVKGTEAAQTAPPPAAPTPKVV